MKKIVIIENNILATNTIRQKLSQTLQQFYDVTILTTGSEKELQLARNEGFKIIDVKASNQNPTDIFHYIRNIYAALKSVRPDVVLTFTIRPAIWGNLITRRLNIPTITNITGIGPLFESNKISYRAARSLYRFALKKTARVFFQNYDDMNLFISRKFVDPAKAERIPGSGVDHIKYSPRPIENRNENFTFLFISRLIRDKGIIEYINAARTLRPELPGVKFQVLGPYWSQNLKSNIISEESIKEWVQQGLIEYLGAADDVRDYIAAADCIVLPSYREGTSNVLLEAGSMEKPAVTCDTTGCNEIVENNVTGFLCRVKDSEDLAEKMKLMYNLSPEKRAEMGKKARRRVIEKFDKQIVIDSYLKAIGEITTGS